MKIYLYSILILVAFTTNTKAETVLKGFPKIIDGDTLTIGKTRLRLEGIDAPELKQECFADKTGRSFSCGKFALNQLRNKIGDREIQCSFKKRDRYKRAIAVCYLDGKDLNRWLVANGLALAYERYTKKYLNSQIEAKKNQLNIWSTHFIAPWDWRSRRRVIR
jgi:endonuclease YncB( thermonuclease family)